MSESVRVSVVMPSLNVAPYIRQCVESVLGQTLRDIEIICVDAGSTDGTLEILEEYARGDSRISIIRSDRKSYGYQMNLGFDAAKGEYLGILETDDYAEPEMFERLYRAASAEKLDVVKAGFYFYYSREERNEPCPIASDVQASRVFCPLTDFTSPLEQVEFFNIKPSIWSAIYRRDFIREAGIRFHETPGASFQDTSFTFQVWAQAKRVRLMTDCFVHYRQDNEASSVNSPGKVYCVCDEYEEIQRFLDRRPELKGRLEPVMCRLKYDTYMWNYDRLSDELKPAFAQRMAEEYTRDMQDGKCEQALYPWYKWNTLHVIMKTPDEFVRWRAAEKAGVPYEINMFPGESFPHKLKRKLIGGYHCLKDHGVIYTWNNLMEKVRRRAL